MVQHADLGGPGRWDPSALLSTSNCVTSRECLPFLGLFPQLESGDTTTYLKIYGKSMN